MRSTFSLSRYIILIGVVALLLCSVALFLFGGITAITTIIEAFSHAEFNVEGARAISVEMIELTDLFLFSTALFITSLGLYQLFIDPEIGRHLPSWLSVHSLEQLKYNLVAVLTVMLIVLFLGFVAGMNEVAEGQGIEILALGGGIALVIAAGAIAILALGRVHFVAEHELAETAEVASGAHEGEEHQ
ncbi:MAG: YqhA family protein [Chloroflexota bacterium]